MKLSKEQIEQARKYFKMMLSHFKLCDGREWEQGGDFYHLPPAQIPVRCVETIRKALSCSTHKTGLCATSDTDKNTPENLRKSLDFIEREYLDYEEKNNKIKGMYIHLDNLRHALSTPKAQEWQPIDVAPMNEKILAVYRDLNGEEDAVRLVTVIYKNPLHKDRGVFYAPHGGKPYAFQSIQPPAEGDAE